MRYLFGIYLVFSVFFSSFVLLIYQNSNHILFQSKELSTLSFTFKNETTKESALKGANALAIVTEWQAFRAPDFDVVKNMLSEATIFDGRNMYDPVRMQKKEINYYSVYEIF